MDMRTCRIPDEYEFKLAEAPEDIEGAYAVRKEVYVDEKQWEDGSDKDELDNKSVFIVAKRDGVVRACLRVILKGSKILRGYPEISRLCISPKFRGRQLAVCLYLATQIILGREFGIYAATFITKPALAYNLGLVFGDVLRVGRVQEHRGLRAPFKITFQPRIAPGMNHIHKKLLEQQLKRE